MVIVTNIYIFIMAIILAILEIQIEGPHGWAKNLPTWRPEIDKWYTKLLSRIFFQKTITGYHMAINLFVLLIFHLPFFLGSPFTFLQWAKTLSLYILFISTWDFIWFILNPHFLLKKFKKEYIPWHVIWFLKIPLDYWISLVLSLLFLTPFIFMGQGLAIIQWWGINILLVLLQLLLVYLFSLFFFKKFN